MINVYSQLATSDAWQYVFKWKLEYGYMRNSKQELSQLRTYIK